MAHTGALGAMGGDGETGRLRHERLDVRLQLVTVLLEEHIHVVGHAAGIVVDNLLDPIASLILMFARYTLRNKYVLSYKTFAL